MRDTPFFTVIVPTYNYGRYLGAALDSLLAQTDPDWEAVVVNDGSTDDTPAVMEAYAKRDPRFRLFHKPNGGVASAMNTGSREARGEWICWLHSDDLFEPRKLAIHREWISKRREGRFFYSHFGELNNSTGEVRDVPPWQPPPDPKWQVLATFRNMFLYCNAVCADRQLWAETGAFDEALRYGQDYDFFLRMVARHPAIHIPERTCLIRRHPDQLTSRFFVRLFYDSAKSAIGLLNRNTFPALVPMVDLGDARQAREAIVKALEIANLPHAFLYALGPHPALLWRILEWAWSAEAPAFAGEIRETIGRWARDAARTHRGTEFGLMWKAAAAATRMPGRAFPYQEVPPAQVAEAHYWSLRAEGDARAEPVRSYLEQFENFSLPAETPVAPAAPQGGGALGRTGGPEGARTGGEVVFVCQGGGAIEDPRQYGSTRVTLEVGKCLTRAGRRVLLVGPSGRGMGFCEGLLFLGVADMARADKALRLLAPVDTLIGISRADILRVRNARCRVIYQLGPHPPAGASVRCVNATGTPVVCVSRDSADAQARWGIRKDLLTVIPPGYSHTTYRNDGGRREPHRWVFAGTVVGYKGVDVALRAFEIVRRRFPDATFDVFGGAFSWRSEKEHLLNPAWLDEGGFPAWPAIERAIPGVRYHGHVPVERLVAAFSRSSILVLPSRGMDTFGLVSVEAQSCGCIPVLPRRCGFPETMREGATGWLYDENTPEALAAAVTALWEKGLPTDGQRQEAARWVGETFSWSKAADGILNVIEAMPPEGRFRRAGTRLCALLDSAVEPLRPTLHRVGYYPGRLRTTPLRQWPGLFRRRLAQRVAEPPGNEGAKKG